jgi:hypothetical protein
MSQSQNQQNLHSHHVIFDESCFPFKHDSSPILPSSNPSHASSLVVLPHIIFLNNLFLQIILTLFHLQLLLHHLYVLYPLLLLYHLLMTIILLFEFTQEENLLLYQIYNPQCLYILCKLVQKPNSLLNHHRLYSLHVNQI